MRLGKTVAVTGDNENDAEALMKADVGFAISSNINCCYITKNSSDIILLDNKLTSILSAVCYGRNMIDSICRFVQF